MIDTIVGVMTQVPLEHRDDAEQHLLSFASEAGYKQVAALGARILAPALKRIASTPKSGTPKERISPLHRRQRDRL